MNPVAQAVPASNGSQQARLARRRGMIQAAGDTFTALGYELSSMALIAEAAGATKATLYAHFDSKAGLFRAVIEHRLTELPEPAPVESPDGHLRTQLDEVARALTRQATHPATLAIACILSRSACIPPKQWRNGIVRTACIWRRCCPATRAAAIPRKRPPNSCC